MCTMVTYDVTIGKFMANSNAVTFRTDGETYNQLAELAKATDRSKSWHIQQAVEGYLKHQSLQVEHIQKGLADAGAGRVIDGETVSEWLQSWGTENEKDISV